MTVEAQALKTILDVTVVPFEPTTYGSGQDPGEKRKKLADAIRERVTADTLARLKKESANKLVTITAVFYLWKGTREVTNTRTIKDLDNLLNVLFDILGSGPQGLGLLESDSFACEVYATKELVDDESEEGYRVVVEEYEDEQMLQKLTEHSFTKKT